MTSKTPLVTSLLTLCSCLSMTSGSSDVKFGVILPAEGQQPWVMPRVLPAIDLAFEMVSKMGLLPGKRLVRNTADSNCSGENAMLGALEMHMNRNVHVFLGPACAYALAPVARQTSFWNIPILSAGGLPEDFRDKLTYRLLTRISGGYEQGAKFLVELMNQFSWQRASLVYDARFQNDDGNLHRGTSYFVADAVKRALRDKFASEPGLFNLEEEDPETDYAQILTGAAGRARVIVVCASPSAVRQLMIHAHDLHLDNGDYVFINLDLLNDGVTSRPWYSDADTMERNVKARRAYESLLTVTARKPASAAYRSFSHAVKERYRDMYGDQFGINLEEDVNTSVAAFFDAVILYTLALNETLEAGGDVTDGDDITHRMWNRTFQSITGTVSIDENGDKNVDYSLWDLNPVTHAFEVVGNFYGHNKRFEPVVGRSIHWAGGRVDPPTDGSWCDPDELDCSAEQSFLWNLWSSIRGIFLYPFAWE